GSRPTPRALSARRARRAVGGPARELRERREPRDLALVRWLGRRRGGEHSGGRAGESSEGRPGARLRGLARARVPGSAAVLGRDVLRAPGRARGLLGELRGRDLRAAAPELRGRGRRRSARGRLPTDRGRRGG